MATDLDVLFRPRAVAVIGASRDRASIGGEVLANLVRGGYNGPVFPVNPNAEFVGSIKCYGSVRDVPNPIDLAVIVVAKELVARVLEDCGQHGVRGAVIITAGFREIGPEGARREAEIKAIALRHGIRLIGPNCMGILNTAPGVHLNATFSKVQPTRGPVAFLSQSGALGETVLSRAKSLGVGLAMFASIGNKVDVSGNDLLAYWGEDDDVEVILLYLENFGNPQNFARIARAVTRIKPVVAVKSGRTAAGARAASSHTGSLAGSDAATEALLGQCGVLRAMTVEELFDLGKAFSRARLPRGRCVAVLSNAGGPGILAADACDQWGLEVPTLDPATQATIRSGVHPDASLSNPIDLIASATPDHYRHAIGPMLADPSIDCALILCVPPVTIDSTEVARAIAEAPTGATVVSCFMGIETEGLELLERAHVPVFDFPESAVRALAALARYRELRDQPPGTVPQITADRARAQALVAAAKSQQRDTLTLQESLSLVHCYGIAAVEGSIVESRDAAIDVARKLGYPVVLKSAEAGHKTDRGAVALDLRSTDDFVAAWDRIFGGAETSASAIVQRMVSGGREVVLGITRDRDLGALVMFGLGGIFIEILRDVAFRLAPLTDLDAHEMVRSIRGLPLLQGARGGGATDLSEIERSLLGIAALASDFPDLAELDVNPLLAFSPGRSPLAVDARVRFSL